MHARQMHTREMHAREMHAREMHAHEIHAYEMLTHEMHEMYESGNFWFVLKHPSPYAGPRRRWPRVSEWDTALRIVWARCQN